MMGIWNNMFKRKNKIDYKATAEFEKARADHCRAELERITAQLMSITESIVIK